MAVGERMPQTSLNSRILQEINVNIRSADQPGSRIPLNFGGDVGVGNPQKNLQVFTDSHLISYLSCADNRIHLYTMIRKHLKSKHVFWYYVPKLFPPSSWRSIQKTNLQKVTQVNHPGPSACTSYQVGCMESAHLPKATLRGKSASWAPSNGEPGEWTCMISRGWGVFLVLKILTQWEVEGLFFFCSDT